MISLKRGTPVAKCIAGKYKDEIICIDSSINAKIDLWASPEYIIKEMLYKDPDYLSLTRKTRPQKKARLQLLIESDEDTPEMIDLIKNDNEGLRDLYDRCIILLEKIYKKELYIPDAVFEPFIDEDKHETYYITGQSGSGKSTYATNLIKMIRRKNPKKKVYIISKLDEDKVYDEIGKGDDAPIRIPTKGEDGYDAFALNKKHKPSLLLEHLRDSIVVFDDTSSIDDKDINAGVQHLLDTICECGRHERITLINTSHLIGNHKASRKILNEATNITFFVNSNWAQTSMFFKFQMGMLKPQIERIKLLGEGSRWITLNRGIPNYILSQNRLLLI
jgi:energy-coupling factor transporter ATP-binding protein EcfA2